MSAIELSVVICNGRPTFPFSTVQSIQSQATANIEIIVVSNHPRSRWTLENLGNQLRVVCALNSKANVSRNLGAFIATSDYVLFLDDDVTIAPDFVEKMIKFVRGKADGAISR